MHNGLAIQGARAALALLMIGSFIPAVHAKKAPKPVPIVMNDQFRTDAASAQAALASGDLGSATARISALIGRATNPQEKYIGAALAMELASKRNDPQAIRRAITALLESGGTPTAEVPYLRYLAGYYSFYLNEFDDAIAQVSYARQLGYTDIKSTVLLSDAYLKKNKTTEGLTFAEQAMAQLVQSGQKVPEAWFDRIISAAYKQRQWDLVKRLYQQRLGLYPSAANWRTAINNALATPGIDTQVQLDLYRLLAANGGLASEIDYATYAKLAADRGFEAEAKSVIESGRATNKLSATEAATVKLLKSVTPKAVKDIAALNALAQKPLSAVSGSAAVTTADGFFAASQYPKAAQYYAFALSKGGVDTNRVNARYGVSLARSGDLLGARAALAQVSGNWSDMAKFWLVWIDLKNQQSAKASENRSNPG